MQTMADDAARSEKGQYTHRKGENIQQLWLSPFWDFFWLQKYHANDTANCAFDLWKVHFPSIRLHHVCAGCIWSCSPRPSQKVAHKFCTYFAPRQMCARIDQKWNIATHFELLQSRIDWIVAHRASGAPRVFQSYCNPCSLSRFVPSTKHKNKHSGNTCLCTHTRWNEDCFQTTAFKWSSQYKIITAGKICCGSTLFAGHPGSYCPYQKGRCDKSNAGATISLEKEDCPVSAHISAGIFLKQHKY